MVTTSQLSFSYPGRAKISFPDISCSEKEILLVLGTSGVGKTTLLHLMGGLLSLQEGDISIKGQRLAAMSAADRDRFRGRHIGIVFQQHHFVESLNVLENCLLAQKLAGFAPDKSKAIELLDRLNMSTLGNAQIKNLSQGEKQRVAIARALMNTPAFILADEPTSALDDQNCHEVLHLLQEQAARANAALVIVTHDNRLKEIIANRVTLEKS
ncbi:MAG: ATP-binding cassette domain-containing protein [Saprospiraceae bacterium]|nr:ATP-binding cassette domain-containing protein [Saprospiraceae bacterium]